MSAADESATPATATAAPEIDARTLLNKFMPHALDTLKREPALAFTLGYVLVALAGIYFNVSYYDEFGIPILTLSQITDYLVAGLQRPIALVLALSTFPLVWIIDRINAARRRRDAPKAAALLRSGPLGWLNRLRLFWYVRPRWLAAFGYIVIVFFYGWLFVSKYAYYAAAEVIQGQGSQVRVSLNGAAEGAPASVDLSNPVTYLGAVTNYVFVYDPKSRHAAVLPVNNISRIEPVETAGANKHSDVIVAPIP